MREIKFRVWNETGKRMSDSGLAVCGNKVVDQVGFKVMQFTGLKDKNGKDIYEGDIVKIESGLILEIIWQDGGYYAHSREKSIFNMPRIIPRITKTSCQGYEVIGNIYENPELLEVQK